MAYKVLTDAFVSIDGNNISEYVEAVVIDYSADMPDDTAMGDDSRLFVGGGLKNWSVTLECFNDYDDGKLDSILWGLVGTAFTVMIRPEVTDVTVEYNGTCILGEYDPINGIVGDLADSTIELLAGGVLNRTSYPTNVVTHNGIVVTHDGEIVTNTDYWLYCSTGITCSTLIEC